MIKEIDLIENKDVRENFIARVEVLDRVKELNTLADTDYMTTRQVAEFYEVDKTVVNQVYVRNAEEINEDGVIKLTAKEFFDHFEIESENILKVRGGILIGGERLAYPDNILYPINAVIRIAFLLRDSPIAKKVVEEFTKEFPEEASRYMNLVSQKRYEEDMNAYLTATFGEENIKRQVNYTGYLIDFVLYDFIAIEVDERGHTGYIELDEKKRESTIKNHYKLFRYDTKEDKYLNFISEVVSYLQKHKEDSYLPTKQVFKAIGIPQEEGTKHIDSMRGEFIKNGLAIDFEGNYYLDSRSTMLLQMTYSGNKIGKLTRDYFVNMEYDK